MSLPAEWLDPSSAEPARDTERGAAPDPEERAERAARADAAAIAARAARASLAASAAGASGAVLDPVLEPTLEPELESALGLDTAPDTTTDPQAALDPAAADAEEPYGRLTLTGGVLGRMILAFVTGCLVITLVPILFGWRPYVVKSGSMEPRIGVGDVILASPDHNPKSLLGHVTVFDDPGAPGTVKSHRIIRINPDGTLTSKGDANPTADPQPVSVAHVHGIGRLLVRWAGLPMIWLRTGQYLFLGLFVLILLGSAWAVARDSEDDEDEDGADDRDDDADGTRTASDVVSGPAATRSQRREQAVLERRARRARTIAVRTLASVAGVSLLVVPSASAAFSATTKTTGSSWTVPTYSYPTMVKSFATPYLYWQLDDTGATAADASGNGRTGTYAGTYTRSVTGATPHSTPNVAVTATTSTACVNTTSTTAITGPAVFTEIIWFKTAAGYTGGGKLIGFETPRTGVGVAGSGGNYDRHLYMDGAGKIWFGVYNGGNETISTPASYNDGSWHMAAATISSAGMALYVDGVLRGTNSTTTPESSTGWWRVGCGNLSGWGSDWTGANNPGTNSAVTVNAPFLGSLDEATIYSGTALSAANISLLYWTR